MNQAVSAQREFSAYGPSHLIVLGSFVIGAVLLVFVGRRLSEAQGRSLSRVLSVLLIVSLVVAMAYKFARLDIQTSVPLQLCDIAEIVAAYALWTQRHWAFVLTYYWGLFLSSQAL
ncbi:MAG TPA: TIGR02206 family membrane protein, partial [Mycobacterium sp.]|nr:TIGR02206 family membrane protein [Mycobacterium sp.]